MTSVQPFDRYEDTVHEKQTDLLVDRDRYRKKYALAAVVSILFAITFAGIEGHMGVVSGLALTGAGISLVGALYHNHMRKKELNEFHIRDGQQVQWKSPIEKLWDKIAATKT